MTCTNKFSAESYDRPVLVPPNNVENILLHTCCAPCSIEVILAIHASGIHQTLYFYNPNIHPVAEYELRKSENKRFCDKLGIPFLDADYDVDNWFERVKGLEQEPERGKRCTACFDMRFERTALHAHESGIPMISSTLGISRWKDMNQINTSGEKAVRHYDDVSYWTYNWRKQGGSQRMIELSKQEHFYQQEYCGCVYSLRDTNHYRTSKGRSRIQRSTHYYGDKENLIAKD